MRISDLCGALQEVVAQHGDLPVYCGEHKISGFAVEPEDLVLPMGSPHTKVLSILVLPRRQG